MTKVLGSVFGRNKGGIQPKYLLLVDLQRAYDSVDRQKLMDMLRKRCKGDTDE